MGIEEAIMIILLLIGAVAAYLFFVKGEAPGSVLQTMEAAAGNMFTMGIGLAKSGVNMVMNAPVVGDLLHGNFKGAGDQIVGTADRISNTVTGVADHIGSTATGIGDKIGSTATGIGDKIGSTATNIGDSIGSAFHL